MTTPTKAPTLLEAARELLAQLRIPEKCEVTDDASPWHVIGEWFFPEAKCPACALRSAIAAEEERQRRPKCATCGGSGCLPNQCPNCGDSKGSQQVNACGQCGERAKMWRPCDDCGGTGEGKP